MLSLTLLAGFVLLVVGGDAFVRGSVGIARRLGVSPLLIGLTLVGLGTSLPELITSIRAALIDAPGIAVGNVVGSNTANILLILGVAALIFPIATTRDAFRRDGAAVLVAALACTAVVLLGSVGRVTGAVFVGLLAAFLIVTYWRERRAPDPGAEVHAAEGEALAAAPGRAWVGVLVTVGGLGLTLLGARLLVDSAVQLAAAAGVSETVIGLTVVAVGTSLPELVTAVMAALRKQPDVAFGNVVGSNIANVFGILGATALVRPIAVPPELVRLDIWVMLGATVLLVAFAVTGWRINRLEGGVLLALYAGYIGWLGATA